MLKCVGKFNEISTNKTYYVMVDDMDKRHSIEEQEMKELLDEQGVHFRGIRLNESGDIEIVEE